MLAQGQPGVEQILVRLELQFPEPAGLPQGPCRRPSFEEGGGATPPTDGPLELLDGKFTFALSKGVSPRSQFGLEVHGIELASADLQPVAPSQ